MIHVFISLLVAATANSSLLRPLESAPSAAHAKPFQTLRTLTQPSATATPRREGSVLAALRSWTAAELITAAKQGIEEAGADGARREANIALALEYFPVLAKDGDFSKLFGVMTQAQNPPALRAWLVRAIVSDFGPPSAFGDYWRQELKRRKVEVDSELALMLSDTTIDRELAAITLQASYRWQRQQTTEILERDSRMTGFAASKGLPVAPALLALPEAPQLREGTVSELLSRRNGASRLAELCVTFSAQPDTTLKECARRLFEEILVQLPLLPPERVPELRAQLK